MKATRVDFGSRAAALYHGKRRISPEQNEMLPDIWRVLEQIRIGKIKLTLAPGEAMIFRCVIRDEPVCMAFYRPDPSTKKSSYDLLVMDIWWSADTN